MSLTHCGRVTQYGDCSMLCKNPIFFTMKEFPQIQDSVIFESRHLHLLESFAKISHFYILTIPGGGSLWRKLKKKSLFQRLWEENGQNSIDNRRVAPWNYFHSMENKILVKSSQNATLGCKKNRAELEGFCNRGKKNPPFFLFLHKRFKFITFNI